MNTLNRRDLLKRGLAACAATTLLSAGLVRADWPKAAYAQKDMPDAIKGLFGDRPVTSSDLVEIKAPDIAENGSVVPITISTGLKQVKSVSIFVEKNPNPLVARFNMGSNQRGKIATRIKIADTSNVLAVVETDDGLYASRRLVKVTIGGCGGG